MEDSQRFTPIARITFTAEANGSLLKHDGKIYQDCTFKEFELFADSEFQRWKESVKKEYFK